MRVRPATVDDAGELLTVQLAAFLLEAQLYNRVDLPPVTERLDGVLDAIADPAVRVLVAELDRPQGRRIVGAARVRFDADQATAYIGRIAVAPDQHGNGFGSALLSAAEETARREWPELTALELFTGAASTRNIEWYQRCDYRLQGEATDSAGIAVVVLRREI